MKSLTSFESLYSEDTRLQEIDKPAPKVNEVSVRAYEKLEEGVRSALETYSNVHRGSGHFSLITTTLFEQARKIILDDLGLNQEEYLAVFCSPYGSELLKKQLHFKDYEMISSRDIGLPLGLRALAIRKSALPKGVPFQTGGSVAKMVSPNFVIWADVPQKFEAGTPCIINVIAFALAIIVKHQYGTDCFRPPSGAVLSVSEILYQDELSQCTGLQLLAELEKMLVGRNLCVPTREGEDPYINFDNAASTPTFFPIWHVVEKIWRQSGKVHAETVRMVRKIIADFLVASPETYEIIFTCNTTEAINMAARFIHYQYKDDSEVVILNTILEHNSNELPWRYIPGTSLIRLSVNKDGFVNPDELEHILNQYNREGLHGKKRIRVVAVSGASNVLGTFNNIRTISEIAHKYGARILVDGAQLVAHRSVNINKWGIDYFAFSGHKAYAPFGSGALLVKKELVCIDPPELQKIRDSGEENIIGIAALGKAFTLLQRIGMDKIEEKERILVRRLLKGLSGIQGIEVYGIQDPDSGNFIHKGGIVSFSIKNVPHKVVARELAERGGIGIRYGCFCAHLLIKHLLKLPPALQVVQNIVLTLVPGVSNLIPGVVRVSFGIENEIIDIERFMVVLEEIIRKPDSNRRNAPDSHLQANFRVQNEKFCETRIRKVFSQA